jgi:rod shape determining protein RodA
VAVSRKYFQYTDWVLVAVGLLIPLLGLVVLYSAGYDPDSKGLSFSWLPWTIRSAAFVKQAIFLAIGIVVMLIALLVPTAVYEKFGYSLYGVTVAVLGGVLLFGTVVNGARRWFSLGLVNFQPGELAKIAVIFCLAKYISKYPPGPRGYTLTQLVIPAGIIVVPMLLIMKQPDLGTALVVGAIGVGMLLSMGITRKAILSIVIPALLAIYPAWHVLHDYQKRRILVLVDPDSDPLGSGYHITQSKIAVGSGAFWGKGYLQGTQSQLEFLPEHTTDFIFSVVGEEWGFVGALIVLGLFLFLIYRVLRVVSRTRDLFSALVGFGVATMFCFHSVVNIGMVLGIFPVVGIPLPLFSYGGSAVLINLACLGVVLGIHMRRFVVIGKA